MLNNPFAHPGRALTTTEVKKLLGSFLGALIDMTESVDTVHAAVEWFCSDDPIALNTWMAMHAIKKQMEELRARAAVKMPIITDRGKGD